MTFNVYRFDDNIGIGDTVRVVHPVNGLWFGERCTVIDIPDDIWPMVIVKSAHSVTMEAFCARFELVPNPRTNHRDDRPHPRPFAGKSSEGGD